VTGVGRGFVVGVEENETTNLLLVESLPVRCLFRFSLPDRASRAPPSRQAQEAAESVTLGSYC
jgi:hypothetical protein